MVQTTRIVGVMVFLTFFTVYFPATLHVVFFFGAIKIPLLNLHVPLTRHVGFTLPSFSNFVSVVRDPRATRTTTGFDGVVVTGVVTTGVATGAVTGVVNGVVSGVVVGTVFVVAPFTAVAAACVPAGPTATTVTEYDVPGVSPGIEQRLAVVSHMLPPGIAVAMYFDTDRPPVPLCHDTIALVSPKLTAVARGAAGLAAVT